jgi:3-oxoacyl-[acyl-carrier-protein] synthase II
MIQDHRKRIVVTGIGWVTPLGHDIETVWRGLLAGDCGIGPISHFDGSTFPTTFAAQVKDDYDWRALVQHPERHRHIERNTGFALGAARQAWASSGLDQYDQLDPHRTGLYLGSGEGLLDFDNYVACNAACWDGESKTVDVNKWVAAAKQRLTQWREVEQEANMCLNHLATELEIYGPAYNCLTACAASTQAIGEAVEILRRGDADVMVSGGAHTMIHPFGVTGFNRLTALSTRNEDMMRMPPGRSTARGTASCWVRVQGSWCWKRSSTPRPAARPFTRRSPATAPVRTPFRITDMHSGGRGPRAAMEGAIANAGRKPEEIHYISAHGTSTEENDKIESKAIGDVFADVCRRCASDQFGQEHDRPPDCRGRGGRSDRVRVGDSRPDRAPHHQPRCGRS